MEISTATERADKTTAGERFKIGAVIRRLRIEKKMTLNDLAEASGVSVGMLSQVERDLSNPSVRVLTGIRQALGAPISALFEEPPPHGSDPSFVRRAGARPVLDLGSVNKELLTAGGAHNLELMILHIDPGGSSGATPLSYPAEKGGMVLTGELTLRVGEEETTLHEGDSFVFDSSYPHSFQNAGKTLARVLWIIGQVALDRHL